LAEQITVSREGISSITNDIDIADNNTPETVFKSFIAEETK
jgi:hypothetical protein